MEGPTRAGWPPGLWTVQMRGFLPSLSSTSLKFTRSLNTAARVPLRSTKKREKSIKTNKGYSNTIHGWKNLGKKQVMRRRSSDLRRIGIIALNQLGVLVAAAVCFSAKEAADCWFQTRDSGGFRGGGVWRLIAGWVQEQQQPGRPCTLAPTL